MDPDRSVNVPSAAEPDIFFLPLSVPQPAGFAQFDSGVLSRRIPHFLHLLLNSGESGPTGLLEVQSPPDDGPSQWVTLQEPVNPEEVIDMVPQGDRVRAIVTGVIATAPRALRIDLGVHFTRSGSTRGLHGELDLADPVAGIRNLATRLARLFGLSWLAPPSGLLTSRGDAFFKFLEGLESAALMSSDFEQVRSADCEKLLLPFSDALTLDPTFGLALRTAHMTIANALEVSRIGTAACVRAFDRCFEAHPDDGEGCVAVAEHLAVLGDDDRAQAWLEHASHLEPPPPRGLENLGILVANRGDTIAARDLWLRGLQLDGHPDFFAHLARLSFAEDDADDAWDKVLRGLRRIYERAVRAAEWENDGRGAGLMLRYLIDHIEDETAPAEVVEALRDLAGVLALPQDRIELGLCLLAVGARDLARSELDAGLAHDVDLSLRDQGVRGLLMLDIPDFPARFNRAAESVASGRGLETARRELLEFLDQQAAFWPALYFLGMVERRLGDAAQALALMDQVLHVRPSQPDALAIKAELLAERGDHAQALAAIDEALRRHDDDARLHAARAKYLHALARLDEARSTIDRAIELAPDERQFRRLRRRFGE